MMRIEGDKKQETEPAAKTGMSFIFLAGIMASAVLLLLGAQLAFLVRLPHLSVLVGDTQAMWLVFSTWPQMSFVLFSCLVSATYQIISGLARNRYTLASAAGRIRHMSRPAIVAAIGISIFLLPLVLAMPAVILLDLATMLLCAVIGCLIFIGASRAGVPLPMLWMLAALSLGFFGNLLMSVTDHNAFTCAAGTVQLRSGESLPCHHLVRLSGKPLWLVEGPQPPRLLLRTDIDNDQVDRALGASTPSPQLPGENE